MAGTIGIQLVVKQAATIRLTQNTVQRRLRAADRYAVVVLWAVAIADREAIASFARKPRKTLFVGRVLDENGVYVLTVMDNERGRRTDHALRLGNPRYATFEGLVSLNEKSTEQVLDPDMHWWWRRAVRNQC